MEVLSCMSFKTVWFSSVHIEPPAGRSLVSGKVYCVQERVAEVTWSGGARHWPSSVCVIAEE